jgi:putative CocE/NonD family hydrolase
LAEIRKCSIAALLWLAAPLALAQEFQFPEAAAQTDSALTQAMPELAKQVLAVYQEADRETYLDNLFRLQMVAGKYSEAAETIAAHRRLRAPNIPGGGEWIDVQYEIFARAKAQESAGQASLEQAYSKVFRQMVGRLDDRTSFLALRAISAQDVNSLAFPLKADREMLKGKERLPLAEALALVRDYQAWDSYRAFQPLALPLIVEDDSRRYITLVDTPVKLPGGAIICTDIVRPRVESRLPALLTFTIYAEPKRNQLLAKMAAAHGYAGVVGLTRGKECSPDAIAPYRYDGIDSAELIDWIAAQPWCDGRVGMFGGSYSGFTAWAAAKHMPKALKAIAVGAAAAPGIDVPMEGNVFWNFLFPWPFYTTDNKEVDDDTYNQSERWNKLNQDWYTSGRAYRDLEKIDGKPNPVFDEWISHPDYDPYWQAAIPYEKEFARITIPILQTAGYYFGGPGAAVYYFSENYKYASKAEHYLLIGPYHHFGAQIGVVGLLGNIFPRLAGLTLDPVALINIEELRFDFFDHFLKKAPMPDLLKDKVNYQVVGANVWKHAPSLEAMANHRLRFYLSSVQAGRAYRLSEQPPPANSFVTHTVNLADRSDANRKAPGGGVMNKELDTWNGLEFLSDPLPTATEMSGLFSGSLDIAANKKDFDFEIDLYELTPKGEYVQLAPYWSRASYAGHLNRRDLLTQGKKTRLDFKSVRLMSRQLQAGSRVVLVLTVIKGPGRQINYGTGKNVSDETIDSAGAPLEIKWFAGSYVDLPVWR